MNLRNAGILLLLLATSVNADDSKQPDLAMRPLILAHYMPWFSAKPDSQRWGWHWTMNHFDPDKQVGVKRLIASMYYPLIGPYDSGDKDVLEYHLLLMKLSGIDGVIVDWYGLSNHRDYAVLHRNTTRLLQQAERLKMKFVICYEDQTIPLLSDAGQLKDQNRVQHAVDEIEWLGKYWFRSPSYVRLNSKPVLLSFGHAGLSNNEWDQTLKQISFPIAYFSQNFRREGATGGFDWPSPHQGIQRTAQFNAESKPWPMAIPVAFPRFVDIYRRAGVSEGYPEIPDNDGKTFRSTMQNAIQLQSSIVQIATWNDWGEGTQIEPSSEFGYRDLEVLQQLCRQRFKQSIDAIAEDLRLPIRILKLRRFENSDSAEVDKIVDLICHGRRHQARAAIVAAENRRDMPRSETPN